MPNWFDIGDATPGRMAVALSMILEGHAVGFSSCSMAVHDGALWVQIDYPLLQRDDNYAESIFSDASIQVESLLAHEPGFKKALSNLPIRFLFVRSDGKSNVQVAEIQNGRPVWAF